MCGFQLFRSALMQSLIPTNAGSLKPSRNAGLHQRASVTNTNRPPDLEIIPSGLLWDCRAFQGIEHTLESRRK